jgi:hypothetical protein
MALRDEICPSCKMPIKINGSGYRYKRFECGTVIEIIDSVEKILQRGTCCLKIMNLEDKIVILEDRIWEMSGAVG